MLSRMTLAKKLVGTIILMFIATMVAIMVYLSSSQKETAFNSIDSEITGTVQFSKQIIDNWMEEKNVSLTAFKNNTLFIKAAETGNVARAQEELTESVNIHHDYENLFIIDLSGKIIADGIGGKSIGQDVSSHAFVAAILEENKTRYSEQYLYRSPTTEKIIYSLAHELKNTAGKRVGLIALSLDWIPFASKNLQHIKVGQSAYIYMLDDKHRFLYHPKPELLLTDASKYDFVRDMVVRKQGTLQYLWVTGEHKFGRFESLTNKPWIVAMAITEDEFLGGIAKQRNILILISLTALLAISTGLIFIIRKLVTIKLGGEPDEVIEIAQRVANGELNVVFDNTKAEENSLYASVHNMVDNLNAVVRDIHEGAANVLDGSQELSSTSQQMSEGATEQAASLEEVSASMEQMAANIRQSSDNAQQTERIAEQVSADAQEGGKAVHDAVNAMKEIANTISVIEEIARQTNLLALNAAIEAARAGEHGKGFAVVASEVRQLALESKTAAGEINQLSKTSMAVAEKAGSLLDSIVPDIQKTANLVKEISTSAQEQDTGVEQINIAIQQLDQVVQQGAGASEEVAATSAELAEFSAGMQESMEYFTVEGEETVAKKTGSIKKRYTPEDKNDNSRNKNYQKGKAETIQIDLNDDANDHDNDDGFSRY